MEKKQKLQELFLMTSFLCCFVVLIHTSSECVTKIDVAMWQHKMFFMFNKSLSFVVPAFVFLSGLKLTYSYSQKDFSFFYFMKKRFTKILIPYTFWYVVYYCFLSSVGFVEQKTIQQHIFCFIMGDLVSPFYFVTVIFQFYLLFGILLFLIRKYKTTDVLLVCTIVQCVYFRYINIPYDDRFFMSYLIYFVLGCVMAENIETAKSIIKKQSWRIYVCFGFFTIWHIRHSYAAAVYGTIYYNWKIFTCLFSMSAIMAYYRISDFITQRVSKNSIAVFKALEESSFYIFLGHCYILYQCNQHWFRVGLEDIPLKFLYNSMIVFFGAFLVSFIYVCLKKYLKNTILK